MLHTKRSLRATRLLLTVLLSIPSLAVSAAGTDTIAFICTVADSMAIYTGTTFTTGTTYDMQNYPLRKGDVVVSFATDSATAAPSWESGNINFCNPSSGSHGNRLTIKSAEGKTLRLAGVRFTFEIDATPTSTTGWFESGSCTLTTSSSYAAAVWVPETGSTPDSVCFWNDNHTGGTWKIRTIRVFCFEETASVFTLCTSADDLSEGDEITFAQDSVGLCIGAPTKSSSAYYFTAVDADIFGHQMTVPDGGSTFILEKSDSCWMFRHATDGYYLCCRSNATNSLDTLSGTEDKTSYAMASISIDESSGSATVLFNKGSSTTYIHSLLYLNSSNPRFACYHLVNYTYLLLPQIYAKTAVKAVDVTISSVGYATLYYGAYNLQVPDGITAYTTALTESESGYTATLTAIEDDDEYDAAVIPAGTAVILYSESALSSGAAVTYSFPVVSSYTGTLSGTNDLLGTDTATVVGTSSDGYLYYQLSQDANETAGSIGFYWGTSDGETLSNGAHKGYLRVKKSSDSDSSGVKAISLALPTGDADEAPSAITSSVSGVALPEGIYTLTGMRLSTTTDVLPAGCYIIDGRKVLIR